MKLKFLFLLSSIPGSLEIQGPRTESPTEGIPTVT
jgi:hypothetical protein